MKIDKKKEEIKSILRKKIRNERCSLSKNERLQKNISIRNNLLSLKEFLSADTILFYCSFDCEADTAEIIKNALLAGKKIIIPKVEGKCLKLFYINNYETDLKTGAFGIMEPDVEKCMPADPTDIKAAVIPGICFDKNFNRIGYGGGYYDRIIPMLRLDVKKIALAFDLQMVEEIPVFSHDKEVDIIITESKIYRKE